MGGDPDILLVSFSPLYTGPALAKFVVPLVSLQYTYVKLGALLGKRIPGVQILTFVLLPERARNFLLITLPCRYFLS